ncbi:MAG TPA: tyrosine-type recombinase/integrase [Terriglobales bacterium]|nr:tyrosine-type recombinase/integrase [Terriglobales bacterium]
MSLYRRGDVWWYKFKFAGQVIRESAKTESKTVARDAERTRRRELERGYNGIDKQERAQLFSVTADNWLDAKKAHLSPRSVKIEELNLKHLKPFFGAMLVCDIKGNDIAAYQSARLRQDAAPKTVNLEVGTLRAILRKQRLWANIQPDVKMLRAREDAGRALTETEETALLRECRNSRSQSLYVAVEVALGTCMRYSEIRLLRWNQIDFGKGELRVGKSKTEHGEGRVIPLSTRVRTVIEFWAERFPNRRPNEFVFPFERYGGNGKDEVFGFVGSKAYETDPTKPVGNWKEAWEAAKKRAGVTCRFHDLRHTGCTRMLEAGVPFSVVSDIMGWSPSTAVRMAKRYAHIGQSARREAVDKLSSATVFDREGAQKWAQWQASEKEHVA